MGWCHEFGSQITEGCDHPMRAEPDQCTCSACGVECRGRFGGCIRVWARGPREGASGRPQVASSSSARAVAMTGGPGLEAVPAALRADDGRLEVLAWLEVAFKEVRAGLELLEVESRRQRRAIKALGGDPGFERLSSLAETLPERIAAATAAALVQPGTGMSGDLDVVSEELRRSTAMVQESVVQLRQEIAYLRFVGLPEHDATVVGRGAADVPRPPANGAAPPSPGRLADKAIPSSARDEWKAVRAKLTRRREAGPGR